MARSMAGPSVTITALEYAQLRNAADKWRLFSAVVRNSVKWADSYGDNERGDLCRGVAEFVGPVVAGVRETLEEPNDGLGTPASKRAWDLAVVAFLRAHEGEY